MKLDFRKDRKSLLKYVKSRVRDYPVYVDAGPGADEDSITQITLGYQFDQAGWAAMVFDTRADAAVDGVWQNYIEENALELRHWQDAFEKLSTEGQTIQVVRPDGTTGELDSEQSLAELIGVFLRDLLIGCRNDGLFDKLPCADGCRLTVEEHEGQFGWTEPADGDADKPDIGDPFAVSDDLRGRTSELTKPKQISFWVGRLEQIAADAKRDPEDFDFDVDANVEELAKIGSDAVVPMLNLAVKLAGKPQYSGDGDQASELYRSWVLEQLIHKVEEMAHATPETERLLQQLVTKAVKVNSNRKLWGSAAFFAAQALYNLFEKYPCPEIGDSDNALLNPKPFFHSKNN